MKGKDSKPHFDVTAGLIWKNGKVLISKRPKGSHLEGCWEFAGGKQEKGESLKDCLEREIEEELGLKVNADQLFMSVKHEYRYKVISLHTFHCTILEGEPKALKCQEVRWVYPAELNELKFPPPDMQVIEEIYRNVHRICRNL